MNLACWHRAPWVPAASVASTSLHKAAETTQTNREKKAMEEKNALEIELAADDLEDHEYVYVASPWF